MKYYFSKKDGHMLTGWQKIGGKKYFLSRSDGHMLTGKQKIDGRWYKFSSKGVLKKTYK
jgi:glucan-binding YG repeat protein